MEVKHDFTKVHAHVGHSFEDKSKEHAMLGIFAETAVMVPVNVEACHWVALVVFPKLRTIQYYNSMASKSSPNGTRLVNLMFAYLNAEYKRRGLGEGLKRKNLWL